MYCIYKHFVFIKFGSMCLLLHILIYYLMIDKNNKCGYVNIFYTIYYQGNAELRLALS